MANLGYQLDLRHVDSESAEGSDYIDLTSLFV